METLDDDFREELRAAFREEAAEHIQSIVSGLLEIEQGLPAAPSPETAETIYRAAHSLKGASRAADMPSVGDVCQVLESVFSVIRSGDLVPSPAGFDTLLGAIQTIERMVTSPAGVSSSQVDHLREALAALAGGETAPAVAEPEPAPPPEPADDLHGVSVRIRTDRLESLLFHAEQMLTAKLAAGERALALRRIVNQFKQWERDWVAIEERMLQLPAGLRQRHRRQIRALDTALHALADDLQSDHRHVGSLVGELLEETKHVLLMPIDTILKPYPRMVRDIARSEDKLVSLEIEGESIALDKRILERLVDPLTHLLRNCIDHGIEPPDRRQADGKPERAVIRLTVTQPDPDRVEVSVADDGYGIDSEAVIRQGVERGILSKAAADHLGPGDVIDLVFHSGLSTRGEVTRLSGRGLGLAIVRENIESLGGTVAVSSAPGKGTVFTLRLPVTVSTFRAVIVRCAGALFAVPTTAVERIRRVPVGEIAAAGNRVPWRSERLPIWRLEHILGLDDAADSRHRPADPMAVLIAGSRGLTRAFRIDAVVGEQEILLRDPGLRPGAIPMLAGATVLGSGDVVPVLDASELVAAASGEAGTEQVDISSAVQRRRVLVAEDSITSRMLLKHLLEGAGYDVETVVDGAAALARVRRERFDLVVSDIEMPRMDGLEFTRRVRGDPDISHLPIILVTTRERPEDEAAGLQAGADGYIMKGRFDRDHLLAVLERLARERCT